MSRHAVRVSVTHNHAGPPPSAWNWTTQGQAALDGYYAHAARVRRRRGPAGPARSAAGPGRPAGSGESRVAVNRREIAPGRPDRHRGQPGRRDRPRGLRRPHRRRGRRPARRDRRLHDAPDHARPHQPADQPRLAGAPEADRRDDHRRHLPLRPGRDRQRRTRPGRLHRRRRASCAGSARRSGARRRGSISAWSSRRSSIATSGSGSRARRSASGVREPVAEAPTGGPRPSTGRSTLPLDRAAAAGRRRRRAWPRRKQRLDDAESAPARRRPRSRRRPSSPSGPT